MAYFDAVVIGGGVLGCFAARNLRRWNISTALLEKEADICTGITRANSAIIYAGYDNKPGSTKAAMTVRGNASFDALCAELEVPFSRCGSLLVTYDPDSIRKLERKLSNGQKNGVPGLRLISGDEALAMEPMLRPGVAAALYAPSTGTVNPWQLGIAACENAVHNGAALLPNTEVRSITGTEDGYRIQTSQGEICCRVVINCAGANADRVQEMCFEPRIKLHLDGAEYLIFDEHTEKPSRVIFHQAQACGKGITAVPCTEGNLLISGVRKDITNPFATTPEGLQEVREATQELLPGLDLTKVIRSFAALRPNPYTENGDDLHDFCIENPGPGFFSLIGIKTPGLTCANELGFHLAEMTADYLQATPNPSFEPHRAAIGPSEDPQIVCQCGQITRAQIIEAIRRGATTVDGVKRRIGSGMGRCQGSRCTWAIEKILEECGHGTN